MFEQKIKELEKENTHICKFNEYYEEESVCLPCFQISVLKEAEQEVKKKVEEFRRELKINIQGYPFPIYNEIPINEFIDETIDQIFSDNSQNKSSEEKQ